MLEDPRPDAEDERRRAREAAGGLYGVPAYQGHWPGAALFAATLVGLTMLAGCWPMARSILGGGSGRSADSRTAATFLALYAAMAVLPAVGWILWGARRRWAAMAVVAIFAACVVWLSPAATL